jgi:hypothetical protein
MKLVLKKKRKINIKLTSGLVLDVGVPNDKNTARYAH